MSFKHTDVIEVQLWNKTVGAISEIARGRYGFRYDPKWLKDGFSLSPLHLPLSTQLFDDQALNQETYFGLPAVFADSLPDKFGNQLINEYMRSKGVVSAGEITPLDRLAYVGMRAMGALVYLEPIRLNTPSDALYMNELVAAARDAIAGKLDHSSASNHAINSLIDTGTSAGGAKAKAVIAYCPETKEVRSGHARDLDQRFEHYLVKFDGVASADKAEKEKNAGRVEYAYYLMAKEAGIDISQSSLIEEHSRAHFLTKRFDRSGHDQRHHIQTACALGLYDYKSELGFSYEQIFGLLKQLNLPKEDFEQLFLRMVFNVLALNCDDHTKNVSFIMRQAQPNWRLAPAYDLTFAFNPHGKWTKRHYLSINGAHLDITYQDIMSVAESYLVPGAKDLYEQVRAAVNRWSKFAKTAGVPNEKAQLISRLIKK